MQKKDLKKMHDPYDSEARTDKGGESNNEKTEEEVLEFTKDEVQTAIDKLKKKVKQVTTTESGPRTSRHLDDTRKEMIRRIFKK